MIYKGGELLQFDRECVSGLPRSNQPYFTQLLRVTENANVVGN